jgi:hypothetical protein
MGQVQAAHRAITVALMYYMKCTVILDGVAYVVVGEVQDMAHAFVCIEVDEEDLMQRIMLLTFDAELTAYDVRVIGRDETLRLGEGQFVHCMFLVALVVATYLFRGTKPDTREELLTDMVILAEVVTQFAQAAGCFCGPEAHEALMQFGAHLHTKGASRRNPQIAKLSAMRKACKPDNPASIRTYAGVLVGARAVELYEQHSLT